MIRWTSGETKRLEGIAQVKKKSPKLYTTYTLLLATVPKSPRPLGTHNEGLFFVRSIVRALMGSPTVADVTTML
jgi:hypothetical protein